MPAVALLSFDREDKGVYSDELIDVCKKLAHRFQTHWKHKPSFQLNQERYQQEIAVFFAFLNVFPKKELFSIDAEGKRIFLAQTVHHSYPFSADLLPLQLAESLNRHWEMERAQAESLPELQFTPEMQIVDSNLFIADIAVKSKNNIVAAILLVNDEDAVGDESLPRIEHFRDFLYRRVHPGINIWRVRRSTVTDEDSVKKIIGDLRECAKLFQVTNSVSC